MTLVDTAFVPTRRRLSLPKTLSTLWHRHRTMSAIAHLDDRLRADVGLPPTGERPLMPHEAAARIAVMAWR